MVGSLLFNMQIPLKTSDALHSLTHSLSFCNLNGKSFGHSPFSFIFIFCIFVPMTESEFISCKFVSITVSELILCKMLLLTLSEFIIGKLVSITVSEFIIDE